MVVHASLDGRVRGRGLRETARAPADHFASQVSSDGHAPVPSTGSITHLCNFLEYAVVDVGVTRNTHGASSTTICWASRRNLSRNCAVEDDVAVSNTLSKVGLA